MAPKTLANTGLEGREGAPGVGQGPRDLGELGQGRSPTCGPLCRAGPPSSDPGPPPPGLDLQDQRVNR